VPKLTERKALRRLLLLSKKRGGKLLRAPIDTNVFVSSNISSFENGASRQVVSAAFDRRFELLISEATLFELGFVLNLPESREKQE